MGFLEAQRVAVGLEVRSKLLRGSFQFGSHVRFNLILSHLHVHVQHEI